MSDAAVRAVRESLKDLIEAHEQEVAKLREEIETLQAEKTELEKERDDLKEEVAGLENTENDALLAVKHWMHDVMYLGKPMSSPAAILTIVERALDPS